jgi:hypothetical protein
MSIKKAVPIIVITWILSLITTLALVYYAPNIFPTTVSIGDGSITSEKIASSAVITVKLADGSVSSAKILDGTLAAVDMADGSIITVKIANGAVTTAKIADNAVNASKIANNAIVTAKLADGSVTSAKILDGSILAEDLADGEITEIKIADGAVTTNKIADYAVTDMKLAGEAIPYNATYSKNIETTSSTTFVDMPNTSVDITVNRNCTLIIMLSTRAWVSTGSYYVYYQAFVNSTQAFPDSTTTAFLALTDSYFYPFTFYSPNVTPGTYTVKIEWRVASASTVASVRDRTLIVIALPT